MGVGAIAGAGVNRHMWIVGFDNLGRAHRRFHVVDGEDERASLVDLRRFQHFRAACIAEERLAAEPFDEFHLLGTDVERRKGHALGSQHAGGDLSETAKTGDHHVSVGLGQFVECAERRHRPSRKHAIQHQKKRRQRH